MQFKDNRWGIPEEALMWVLPILIFAIFAILGKSTLTHILNDAKTEQPEHGSETNATGSAITEQTVRPGK